MEDVRSKTLTGVEASEKNHKLVWKRVGVYEEAYADNKLFEYTDNMSVIADCS